MLTDQWKTSTRSGGNGCVEVMRIDNVRVRDSQTQDSPILAFHPEQWKAFIDDICAGRHG
jgi:Domain of unknown function (DUF397)